MIVYTAIVPHPPLSIPGVGSGEDLAVLQKTVAAFQLLRKKLEQASPDVVIIISPHAPLEPYHFVINSRTVLEGSLSQFGVDEAGEFRNDLEIAELIEYACEQNEIPIHRHEHLLDYGALVPFHHLLKNINPHVVQLSFSFLNLQNHYRYGELIAKACAMSDKRIAIIASGDLSHRLSPDAPAGYSPRAQYFDRQLIEILRDRDLSRIIDLHRDWTREVAECGLRAFVILLGVLHGKEVEFKLLSYEHPFGVGYLVAEYA